MGELSEEMLEGGNLFVGCPEGVFDRNAGLHVSYVHAAVTICAPPWLTHTHTRTHAHTQTHTDIQLLSSYTVGSAS